MMEQLTKIVSEINGFLWGMYCLIPLLCGVGIYFTLKLDFIQIRRFGLAVKSTFGGLTLHGERAGKQGMSSFQSLATAIAAQVGTGNLAGAATAIAMGGPGAHLLDVDRGLLRHGHHLRRSRARPDLQDHGRSRPCHRRPRLLHLKGPRQ